MTHYDHATAMFFKLDRWSKDRPLKNYELEALACQQRTTAEPANEQSLFKRCLLVFVTARICRVLEMRRSRILDRFK